MALLDPCTGDDEWHIDFLRGIAAMSVADASVISYDDKDRALQHVGFFDSLDYFANGLVDPFYCFVVLGAAMAIPMPGLVHIIEMYK